MKEKISEEDFRDIDMGKYAEDYSDDGLWDKIRDNVASIGLTLIYKVVLCQDLKQIKMRTFQRQTNICFLSNVCAVA